jgi:DMSO/TMAO reductase YedYZ molybdopterin-dependent catalytic subunit
VGTAEWGGALLADLLKEAGLRDGAVEVLFTGLDRGVEGGVAQSYQRSLALDEAMSAGAVLAYEMNGGPVPPQHGYPVRLVVPGWYGMTNVKWLARIDVLSEPFDGYQNSVAYRMYDEDGNPGESVTRMMPRSLTVPPGVPDFMSRERHVEAGEVTLRGRAWSGWAPVERVEVSTDGGGTWADAALDPPLGEKAWRAWSWAWNAEPGEHVISSRATDAAGNTQPLEPGWNLKGYANNAVERMSVRVA